MKLKLFGRKRELKHSEVLEQLSPYFDGRLEAGERTRLELHLQSCQGCSAELEAMRAASALLRTLPPTRLPRDFTLQFAPRPVVATPGPFWALRLASGVAAAAFVALFAASALLPAVWARQSDSTVTYQSRPQAPQTLSAPSTASSQADAAAPKRAAPASAPVAPAAALGAPDAAPVAPAAAPVAPPAADGNSLESLLATLEVTAGSLALLLGLAAATVWWKHKSLG